VALRASLSRRRQVVSLVAAALMGLTAINLVVVFVLLNAQGSTDIGNLLPALAIGALPFLGTAVLIIWTVVAAPAEAGAGETGQQNVATLIAICGVGLLLMVACGFWAGLFAAAHVPPPGSPAADALDIYQYMLVAAVLADAVTLVLALVTRTPSR
jgi:hypothetical protein